MDLPRLLAAASAGDGEAWRALVNAYSPRVFAMARSRIARSDAAEEITQSVFVTLASKLTPDAAAQGYTERGRFESWLFRIAMNRVRDEVRRLKRHAEPMDPEALTRIGGIGGGLNGASAESEREAGLTDLRSAVARLSEADREVIQLRHHGGLSFAQIAEMLGEPLGTLLARHHRALRKLKEMLAESGTVKAATERTLTTETQA
ncbi:sigma-70 family RNA polymerase sigma factor [soil metagenome]